MKIRLIMVKKIIRGEDVKRLLLRCSQKTPPMQKLNQEANRAV
jgi:hypothetical protein